MLGTQKKEGIRLRRAALLSAIAMVVHLSTCGIRRPEAPCRNWGNASAPCAPDHSVFLGNHWKKSVDSRQGTERVDFLPT
jgi:hypothetical protein